MILGQGFQEDLLPHRRWDWDEGDLMDLEMIYNIGYIGHFRKLYIDGRKHQFDTQDCGSKVHSECRCQ